MTTWPDQRAVEVADGVVAVLHGAGEAGVANAGFVIDGSVALVVDTMMFPAMAAGLRRVIESRGVVPSVVLNTHQHIDHIGGNAVFSDVPIIAHPVAADVIVTTGLPVPIFDAFMPAFRGEFAKLGSVHPPEPWTESEVGTGPDLPGGAAVRSYVPAHTSSDTVVWVERERVLFTGDLCFFGVSPLAVQGLVSGWVRALDDLIALAPEIVVPGHGPVGTVEDVIGLRDHLASLQATARAAVESGASLEDAFHELDKGPVGDWLEAERIKPNLERAMQEARGEISADSLDALPPSAAELLHY